MIVNEIVSKFSFKGSTKPLDKFNISLKGAIKGLGLAGVAMAGIGAGITKFVNSTSESIDPLIQLSKRTGESVENLQRLAYASEQTGGSTESLYSSIDSLSKKIGEASISGSDDFAMLGISVRDSFGNIKKSSTVIDEISDRFKNLSQTQKISFADKLGIDTSLVNLLSKGASGIATLGKEADKYGILTSKNTEGIEEYNKILKQMSFALTAVKNSITVALIPSLKGMMKGFAGTLSANKELISKGLKVAIKVIGTFFSLIKRLGGYLVDFIKQFKDAKVVAIGFGVAIAAILAPATLITGAIIGVLLVIDDLITAFRGGKSVIADFISTSTGINIVPIMKDVVAYVKVGMIAIGGLFTGIMLLFDSVYNFITGDFSNAFKSLEGVFTTVADIIYISLVKPIEDFFDYLADKFAWVQKIKSYFGGEEEQEVPKAPKRLNSRKQSNNNINRKPFDMKSIMPGASFNKLVSVPQSTNSNINNNMNNNYSVDVQVQGSNTSGGDIGKSIKQALMYNQNRDASNFFNRGGV